MMSARSLLPLLRTQILPHLARPRAVLLVGSFAEGFANRLSDVDLIAVTRTPRISRFRFKKQMFLVDGRVVVATYFTAPQLRGWLRRLDTLYRTGGYLLDRTATRLAHAVVVHDSDGIGRSLVREARRYRLQPKTVRQWIMSCLAFHEDALGNLMERDPETAMIVARQAATLAVDCFLLERGIQDIKSKWHLRRLRSIGADGVLSAYREIMGLESMQMKRATEVLVCLDHLISDVFEVPTIHDCERSPLIARAAQNSPSRQPRRQPRSS